MYDVVVAGGSISGMLCAREIAAGGRSVLVIEEDYEIGTPDHCGGLVSCTALEELGIIPGLRTLGRAIKSARVHSPSGKSFEINSARQKIVEISRRELDKQAALQAQRQGAEIRVNTSLREKTPHGIRTDRQNIDCKILVDARGISSLIQKDRAGVIPSAQYEVYADWIGDGKVEVFFDNTKYPGFFAWIIPSSDGAGKVGVAGRGINAASAIEEFLEARAKSSIVRRIFAPIWVDGPVKRFIDGDTVIIGDAAGQTKPTTAGGIFSCGMGGILAGRAIVRYLESGNHTDLEEYQRAWTAQFGGEFGRQLRARKMLEKLDNHTIDGLFDTVTPEVARGISEGEDFDFHAGSIVRLLGARGSLSAARKILGGRIRGGLGG